MRGDGVDGIRKRFYCAGSAASSATIAERVPLSQRRQKAEGTPQCSAPCRRRGSPLRRPMAFRTHTSSTARRSSCCHCCYERASSPSGTSSSAARSCTLKVGGASRCLALGPAAAAAFFQAARKGGAKCPRSVVCICKGAACAARPRTCSHRRRPRLATVLPGRCF